MPACCAVNCTSRPEKSSGKTFHLFPRSKPDLYRRWVVAEHSYAVLDTPKTLKRKLDACTDSAATVKRKLKLSLERERRLRRKVSSFNEIIDDLKHKQLISEDASAMLERCFMGIPLEVTKRLLKQTSSEGDKSSVKLSRDKYSPALRAFALTLQFYSTKAYNYARETFQCSLPHPSTITKWYSSINGEPGLTSEAINAIRAKANEAKKNNKQLLCNLVDYEMAIRKHLEWDGKKFRGYVDIGMEVDDDSNAVASEVNEGGDLGLLVKGGRENCESLDNTRILYVSSQFCSKDELDMATAKRSGTQDLMQGIDLPDESELDVIVEDLPALSPYLGNVVGYIVGFVCRMVKRKIPCAVCYSATIAETCGSALLS
ncbi:hypothetical protein HPB51_010307 [Rhipicephalus microplus]|uniref:THAP-type domain-containing protein n=1 Tax=Rhipicephalus microplus TaxID=6941 RepID=A0A9J6DFM9_RHIMP|nr:hypothetical protein HPB51_010307 [Rhipicephalus microplus]